MAGMSEIVKGIAKGLEETGAKLNKTEAKKMATTMYNKMDSKVLDIAKKDYTDVSKLVSSDLKNFEGKIGDYAEKNSFTDMKSFNNLRASSDPVFAKYHDAYEKATVLGEKVGDESRRTAFANNIRDNYAGTDEELKKIRNDYYGTKKNPVDHSKVNNYSEPINNRLQSLVNESDNLDDMLERAYSSDKAFNMEQASRRIENMEAPKAPPKPGPSPEPEAAPKVEQEAPQSSSTKKKTMEESIKNKKQPSNFEDWQNNRYDEKIKSDWDKYQSASEEEKKKMNSKFGIKDDGTAEEKINDFYTKQKENGGSFGIGDKMLYHKVPQKVVGGGAIAWLVSNMSNNKGQMPNQQLYGQQSPYNNNGGGMY